MLSLPLLLTATGCRHSLDTTGPVPRPAATILQVLLALRGADGDAAIDAAEARLRPLLGADQGRVVIAGWQALVDEHGPLQPGTPVVIESAGVVSANLNVAPAASGPGAAVDVGRLRVVVGPDEVVRQVDVLPPLSG